MVLVVNVFSPDDRLIFYLLLHIGLFEQDTPVPRLCGLCNTRLAASTNYLACLAQPAGKQAMIKNCPAVVVLNSCRPYTVAVLCRLQYSSSQ